MSLRLTVTDGPPAGDVIHHAERLGIAVIGARFHRDASMTYVLADDPSDELLSELRASAELERAVAHSRQE